MRRCGSDSEEDYKRRMREVEGMRRGEVSTKENRERQCTLQFLSKLFLKKISFVRIVFEKN